MFFAWLKLWWNNEGRRHYIFKEEATGLSYLVAFFTARTILPYDVVDLINNILPGNGTRKNIWIVGKKKTHLQDVITDGAWRIMFGSKHIEKL